MLYLVRRKSSRCDVFEEKIGFCVNRKRRKLRDVVDILESFGKRQRAAIEWIRRYKYVTGKGRERWYRRKKPLKLENAKREYIKHLISRG